MLEGSETVQTYEREWSRRRPRKLALVLGVSTLPSSPDMQPVKGVQRKHYFGCRENPAQSTKELVQLHPPAIATLTSEEVLRSYQTLLDYLKIFGLVAKKFCRTVGLDAPRRQTMPAGDPCMLLTTAEQKFAHLLKDT